MPPEYTAACKPQDLLLSQQPGCQYLRVVFFSFFFLSENICSHNLLEQAKFTSFDLCPAGLKSAFSPPRCDSLHGFKEL